MVNQGFFGNISNTIHLMKSCVKVLKKDKELVLFPILAALFVIILLGVIFSMGGISLSDNQDEQGSIIPLAILIFGANFIIVFFHYKLELLLIDLCYSFGACLFSILCNVRLCILSLLAVSDTFLLHCINTL